MGQDSSIRRDSMEIITALITPILTGLVVWFIERHKTEKDELKEEADQVDADINYATMQLAYATAMAVKRGKANGEVEDAIEDYNRAKTKRDKFNEKIKNKVV